MRNLLPLVVGGAAPAAKAGEFVPSPRGNLRFDMERLVRK